MNNRTTAAAVVLAGVTLVLGAAPAEAGLIAATSVEAGQGYTPAGKDVRSYTYASLTEPGDWGGNTFAGTNGGDLYTGVLAGDPGTAFAGDQFFFMQRSGTDSNGDILLRRKFPTQTGLLYYRWAFRIDSSAAQAPYWQVSNNLNFSLDRKIDSKDGTDSNVGTETARLELHEDGRIQVKQSSFGGDITLTKRWDGTTTDGSDPIASALNGWVKVEVLADISAQRYWLFWNDTPLGIYRFRRDLTSSAGIRQVNMIRFQCPRLHYDLRGERLRVDDIELRTDPPAALPGCVLLTTPGDMTVNANAGQPAVPSTIDYSLQNFGSSPANWTATILDASQNPAPVPWLSISGTAGTLESLQNTSITASIDAAGVPGGEHIAYVRFSDGCNPATDTLRQIRLVVTGCTWTVDSCNQVRSYLLDYPTMHVEDVVYRITNTGQQSMNYTVAMSGSSCLEGMWTLANAAGTIGVGSSADVVATFHPEALAAASTDDAYTCNLLFSDDCSAQTVSRTIRLRYMGVGDTPVFRFNGNMDPLVNDSSGPNLRCDLYREDGLTPNGAVEDDPAASNGKVWRIQDGATTKTKYRFTHSDGSGPIEIANEIGATIVARVKVLGQTGSREGGLYMWEEETGSCVYHWGGADGIIQEVRRGGLASVPGSDGFVILRMTSIGRKDAPWDCSRIIRLYFNEDPVPVVELVGAGNSTALYEGLGFGAGSTSGTYDIAFDWVSGTNAGAFGPGEEEAVLGFSLVGLNCPADWADLDGDHDVDQVDFGLWQLCVTGTGDPSDQFQLDTCGCLDRDHDEDVDINDAAVFAACATGPNVAFDRENPPEGCY